MYIDICIHACPIPGTLWGSSFCKIPASIIMLLGHDGDLRTGAPPLEFPPYPGNPGKLQKRSSGFPLK